MRTGGLDVTFDIVYTRQTVRSDATYAEAQRQARESLRQISDAVRRCQDQVALARTPEDLERIVGSGKLAVVIGIVCCHQGLITIGGPRGIGPPTYGRPAALRLTPPDHLRRHIEGLQPQAEVRGDAEEPFQKGRFQVF